MSKFTHVISSILQHYHKTGVDTPLRTVNIFNRKSFDAHVINVIPNRKQLTVQLRRPRKPEVVHDWLTAVTRKKAQAPAWTNEEWLFHVEGAQRVEGGAKEEAEVGGATVVEERQKGC